MRIAAWLTGYWLSVAGVWGAELLPPGNRPEPPAVHALVGARLVTSPGKIIEQGTVIIRDEVLVAVGSSDLPVPSEARVWDLKGRVVYAGFIDPYLVATSGTNAAVRPGRAEEQQLELTAGRLNFFGVPGLGREGERPVPGSELTVLNPERRAVLNPALESKTLEDLQELGFTVANVVPDKGCVRGTSALVLLAQLSPNQRVLRSDVFQCISLLEGEGGRDAGYPASLMGQFAAVRQLFLDAQHHRLELAYAQAHPGGALRVEFNPALAALFACLDRKTPVLFETGSPLVADRAARVGAEWKIESLMLASGHEWRRPDLAAGTGAGFIVPLNFPDLPKLPEDEDWDQVTLDALRQWDWAPENPALLRTRGVEVALTLHGLAERSQFRRNLQQAMDRGLSEEDALAALTTVPARWCGAADRLGTIEPGRLANLTIVDGSGYFDPEARVEGVWVAGRYHPARPDSKKGSSRTKPPSQSSAPDAAKESTEKSDKTKKANEQREWRRQRVAREAQAGRGVLAAPAAVLVRGATLWTESSQGRLTNADLLVVDGKIRAVGHGLGGEGLSPLVVEGTGLHVTPGLIDAHSHSMILGGVNEATLPSTAMVRIGDVINSETANIYWQLAGGLTVANLLHGSANPIGGQSAVIKLKDGASPEELKIPGAAPGIKFALGENVKQSNWGENATTRFPQSRMGVPVFMANRFTAAQQYLASWEAYEKAPTGSLPPPRRDLELETIGEILQGKRWIHCHSYRQDEILAFLRVMESFHVRVGTLQHVLEGYKVADEIARHGAGASCFSDWWAYKHEVMDAIPYAGSLMRARGVLVSFNSDSSDHARRLNTEAAKAVKYGGTPEEEALALVTINAARQLRLEQRLGSLEPGKDGDFAIWSGSPLDTRSYCRQTWIEGRKYFDFEMEAARSDAYRSERQALIEKAKKLAGTSAEGVGSESSKKSFFEVSLEHRYDGVDRHCQEEER